MIIERENALVMVANGRATEEGLCATGDFYPQGDIYVIVTRHDLMRTDHYLAEESDIERLVK